MKLLLDENVPNMYKDELIRRGYEDIIRINDFGKGLPDSEVFNVAMREERTIFTRDKDFYDYKKKENYGIVSISGKLKNPIDKFQTIMEQIERDQRFAFEDLKNVFIRITNQDFTVTYKKKNKYKETKCKYKEKVK